MKTLILAAGYGTRLAAIAPHTPKPLIDINGRPMINYVLDQLKGVSSLTEAVVVTNNKFIKDFQEWSKTYKDVAVRVVNDGTNSPDDRLGSVGDIHFVLKNETAKDDWLIIGGDNLFDQPLKAFVQFAQSKAPAISIGLYDIHDIAAASKFGVSTVESSGKVIDFQEKPAQPSSSLITMLVYYFPKESLEFMDDYRNQSTSMDTAGSYIQWLVKTKCVYGFQFVGKWYDIGSVESLIEARQNFV